MDIKVEAAKRGIRIARPTAVFILNKRYGITGYILSKLLYQWLKKQGIRIALHPDDPPLPALGGIPRIFSSFEAFKRAFEIADSPNVGIYLCVGCWLEGGKLMGKNVLETIRYFGERNRIFKVDFRNVSAPLPHFVENLSGQRLYGYV